jgi:Protein of unknown function (DUF1003)
VSYLRRFGRFWWTFVVGDNLPLALGAGVTIALTAVLVHKGVNAWWLMPAAIVALLALGVLAATRDHPPIALRPLEPNPVLADHARKRAEDVQNRIADRITDFAGSMRFVYLHVLWFGLWIGLGAEKYPYGLLTMIVSLEAIFLSTFVMISQNRADAKRQVLADQQWQTVQDEDKQNQELLDISNQILALTKEVHAYAAARNGHVPPATATTTGTETVGG